MGYFVTHWLPFDKKRAWAGRFHSKGRELYIPWHRGRTYEVEFLVPSDGKIYSGIKVLNDIGGQDKYWVEISEEVTNALRQIYQDSGIDDRIPITKEFVFDHAHPPSEIQDALKKPEYTPRFVPSSRCSRTSISNGFTV